MIPCVLPPALRPALRPYLPQDRHRLKRLDSQVLGDEEHAVVGEIEALSAPAVVSESRVPTGIAFLRWPWAATRKRKAKKEAV